jgi:3-oxoacyl-[acyl-carrier protein] reductase
MDLGLKGQVAMVAGASPGSVLLVTNSGGPPPGRVNSFDDAGWQNAFELILFSAVRVVRLVAPSMTAASYITGATLQVDGGLVRSVI